MSQENIEIVRAWFAAFEPSLDDVADFWHPDIDWRAIEGAPDDIGVFRGPEAMRRYYEQWYETFDDLRAAPEELIDAGEQVVAVVHVTAQMKKSDSEIDMRMAIVLTLRDGKIARGREYASKGQALEAAGLSE